MSFNIAEEDFVTHKDYNQRFIVAGASHTLGIALIVTKNDQLYVSMEDLTLARKPDA